MAEWGDLEESKRRPNWMNIFEETPKGRDI